MPKPPVSESDPSGLASDAFMRFLRQQATALGFVKLGIAPAIEISGFSNLAKWVDAGYAGQMTYIADRLDAYRHPSGVLEGCQSVIALAYPYPATPVIDQSELSKGAGKIARYASTGNDYHDVIHPKLKCLCKTIRRWKPESKARGVVDTAPMMERQFAELAGIGWRGKNTLLLNKELGSYFFIACVLTDVELPTDSPHHTSHCGTCTACLDACPTDAFVGPGVLDATRCISYLTIEHRGAIDEKLHEGIGDWVFGCDVCQEVCPWNRKPARHRGSNNPLPSELPLRTLSLSSALGETEESFRRKYRKTALWRTRLAGIQRNARIVIRNQVAESLRDSQHPK
ncbi:Epoxyqueuosine reductase [Novipirellula aureliae]|uniref:Epoxyqueuosine reductase n=1 Tax=Novipirellula aureliae TaxID=2527966 RepID=A0A5C6DM25_9BACT|nr:tRNA epoxyqueuosine(34) reductase QueG [Novipirellula aureliae]TWU37848.1 Epoxyqueuosine reductase [Novipirellula aureliae]